jgi:hypothetical protein
MTGNFNYVFQFINFRLKNLLKAIQSYYISTLNLVDTDQEVKLCKNFMLFIGSSFMMGNSW